jgi:VanZ family protein
MAQAVWKAAFISGLVAVAVLSLAPAGALPDPGISDKLSHLIAYGALTVLGRAAYPRPAWGRLVAGMVLYGALLEGLQAFVPGRFMSGADLLANTLGVLLGFAGFALTRWVRGLAPW